MAHEDSGGCYDGSAEMTMLLMMAVKMANLRVSPPSGEYLHYTGVDVVEQMELFIDDNVLLSPMKLCMDGNALPYIMPIYTWPVQAATSQ